MSDTEDAFEKFKETWEPSDELAAKAKAEEKRLEKRLSITETTLQKAITDLTTKTVALQTTVNRLGKLEKRIRSSEDRVNAQMLGLEQMIEETREWWDGKTDEIRKLMGMMAAMGFEIDLG